MFLNVCVGEENTRKKAMIRSKQEEKKRAEREERERGRRVPKSGWPKATSLLLSGTEVVQMIED